MFDDWDEQLRLKARRKTANSNLLRTAQTVSLIAVPAVLQAMVPSSWDSDEHPYLLITTAFIAYVLLLLASRLFVVTVVSPGLSFRDALIDPLSLLVTWFVIALFGYFLSTTNLILLTAGWCLCAVPLLVQRYFERQRDLRGARLVDRNYKLIGFFSGKRRWRKITGKLGSAKLYVLPDNSPLGQHSVRVMRISTPEIYIGAKARDVLGPHAFRAVLAHEFGHSLATSTIALEALSWGLRLFGLPLLVAGALQLLYGRTGLPWLTVAVLAWLLWRWLSLLLHRQVEYAADRYAVEATRNHAAFIDGLKRLAAVQPRNVFPNFLDALGMNSHACVLWRIRRIERLRKAFDKEAGEKSARRSRQLK